ncbi:hypothetical protein H7849_22440 [Alloacidobacterium dinghuense]|uniref:Uncharacterized protein n=1 Tax=Alloacidobacterium dinghuense TaxID=2763107 RepID=A0A7G8BGV1_9BACT|nr:hypothetical protein [Alloacidobacterium dinghuense]QNI31771.1 hypothetical protein H7849_22440 [Alloacidobacterium dinghuense]
MLKVISLLLSTALASQAQQVTLATPSSMQFSDPDYRVSFRYPAKWYYNESIEFYTPTSITSPDNPPRGFVYFSSNNCGYNPYPRTNLVGAEFVYANRQATSTDECLKSVLQRDANAKMLETEEINGMSFAHAQTASAGMCHSYSEDIYATHKNGTCYLFDLAVVTLCPGLVDNTRPITNSELAQVHTSLEKILSSVEISEVKKN